MQIPAYQVERLEGDRRLAIISAERGESLIQDFSTRVESLLTVFHGDVPAVLEDLIDVAATVYVADRAIRRRPPSGENGRLLWQRDLDLRIPVTEPDRWNRDEIKDLLSDALGCLTEDRWKFNFLPRKRRGPLQRVLVPPASPVKVALFSGGLDSLAGLAIDLETVRHGTILAVSCGTGSRLLNKQRKLLRSLRRGNRDRLLPIIVPVKLLQNRQSYNQNEPTQRARGFLFCILGAVTAVLGDMDELSVYENGVGAINLPLSEAQLGAQSSRATNPIALQKIERFISLLLEKKFSIRLPYLFLTKGQMCEKLGATSSKDLAFVSVSCDSFPLRISGAEHCGTCSSCLLRRQALWTAGLHDDLEEGRYRHDVFSGVCLVGASRLGPWWDMLSQVDRLDNSLGSSKNPWANLTVEFPELLEVAEVLSNFGGFAAGSTTKQRLLNLYRDYCKEWHGLPAYPKGWRFSAPDLRLSA